MNVCTPTLTILALATTLTSAQQTKAKIDDLPTFPLSGRVIDSSNGNPIAGAKVTVAWIKLNCTPYISVPGEPVPDCAVPAQYNPEFKPVFTDSAGQFRFAAVPRGLVNVHAEAHLFFDEWPIHHRPDDSLGNFTLGGPIQNVELRLLPASAIRGVLLDKTDHPIANTQVSLSSSKVYGQGFTTTFYNRSLTTGSDGTFTFGGLSPGDYFLNTEGHPASPTPGGEPRIYPSAHWPESEPALASPNTMHLAAGVVASATLRVKAERLHHVRGQFRPGPITESDAFRTSVMAISEYGGWTCLQTESRENGVIDLSLPDGRYKIVVQTIDNHADTMVEVTGGDLAGVSVQLGTKVRVPVTIKTSNPPKQQSMPGFSTIQQATFGFQLMLFGDPANGQSFGTGTGVIDSAKQADAAGISSFDGQLPGKYLIVTADSPPWYVASIIATGRNLAAEPYTITDQEHASPIDVLLRADGGTVSGVVYDNGAPTSAFVYALPTFAHTSLLRVAIAHADGVYRLEGLAPGSYRIFAFDHEVAIPFREDISPWLARGRPLTIAADSNAQLQLDLEP